MPALLRALATCRVDAAAGCRTARVLSGRPTSQLLPPPPPAAAAACRRLLPAAACCPRRLRTPLLSRLNPPGPHWLLVIARRSRERRRSPEFDPEAQRRRPTWFDIPPIGGAPPPLTQLPGAVQVFPGHSGAAPAADGGPGLGGGAAAASAMSQQATRHARRIYVGGLPPQADEHSVQAFFSNALAAVGGTTAGPGMSVVNVYHNAEKKFAFVEFRTGAPGCWGGLPLRCGCCRGACDACVLQTGCGGRCLKRWAPAAAATAAACAAAAALLLLPRVLPGVALAPPSPLPTPHPVLPPTHPPTHPCSRGGLERHCAGRAHV